MLGFPSPISGPDQGMTSWRAQETYAYVQGTDPPLKMRLRIWPSTCVWLIRVLWAY